MVPAELRLGEGAKPVPPGPGNPLGTRWMGLTRPASASTARPTTRRSATRASHGCIRMHVPDAEWLFDHVDGGTPVVIV